MRSLHSSGRRPSRLRPSGLDAPRSAAPLERGGRGAALASSSMSRDVLPSPPSASLRAGERSGVAPAAPHVLPFTNETPVPRGRTAFTLLEIILAISMTVGLVGATLGFHRYVVDARRDVLEQSEAIGARRRVMERLTGELRRASAHPFVKGMTGGPTWIVFTHSVVPGRSVWAETSLTETPPPAECDLERVCYQIRWVDDEAGELRAEGIERLIERRDLARDAEDPSGWPTIDGEDLDEAPPVGDLLAGCVRAVAFRYHDGTGWLDHWPPTEEDRAAAEEEMTGEEGEAEREQRMEIDLPLAVEIILGDVPLGEDEPVEDYIAARDVSRRVVFIPAGARALSSTVRGLRGGGR